MDEYINGWKGGWMKKYIDGYIHEWVWIDRCVNTLMK